MIVKAVRHVGINTDDIHQSVEFYKQLGFNKILYDKTDSSEYINKLSALNDESLHMIKLFSEEAQLTIELVQYKQPDKKTVSIRNIGTAHLALQVTNAKETYQHLKRNNMNVLSEPLLSSDKGAYVFFCYDPNGFRIEFVELINQ